MFTAYLLNSWKYFLKKQKCICDLYKRTWDGESWEPDSEREGADGHEMAMGVGHDQKEDGLHAKPATIEHLKYNAWNKYVMLMF